MSAQFCAELFYGECVDVSIVGRGIGIQWNTLCLFWRQNKFRVIPLALEWMKCVVFKYEDIFVPRIGQP